LWKCDATYVDDMRCVVKRRHYNVLIHRGALKTYHQIMSISSPYINQ